MVDGETSVLLVGLAALFVLVGIWKVALLGHALLRLGSATIRRRPALSVAIRSHVLHLLLASVGASLLLTASRLPGQVNVYVPECPSPPPPLTPSPTPSSPIGPPPDEPSPVSPSPSPTSGPAETRTTQLKRLNFSEFPAFAEGRACDDDRNLVRKNARRAAIETMGGRLEDLFKVKQLQFIIVVGTFDHKSLSRETSLRYDSNVALAQERAECVAEDLKRFLGEHVSPKDWDAVIHTMVAGPRHSRSRIPTDPEREEDRGIRILVGLNVPDEVG